MDELEIFAKVNKRGRGFDISIYLLISVMSEKRYKIHKYLILMFNFKVRKQTRNEASKNNVIIKSIKYINKSSTSM